MCYFCRVKIHEIYLSRCLQLAKNGRGTTAPNPAVGAVVVCDNTIVGQGFTSPYGGPHAEVNAIGQVSDPELLRRATLYVTLEPCNHFGKTPPCTDLILRSGIPKVVIGIRDPHHKVNGSGMERLRQAGVEVISGILEAECRYHHRRFLTFHEKQRPYILLKWAQSADGFLAPPRGLRSEAAEPFWISGKPARQLAHKWRTEEQAILVGTQTALEDNPKLDARTWAGKNPLRIVLDRQGRIPYSYTLYNGKAPTWVLCGEGTNPISHPNVEHIPIPSGKELLPVLMRLLHQRNIQSLMVEGGAQTLQSFMDAGLWDEARVFTGTVPLGGGIAAPKPEGRFLEARRVGEDQLEIWHRD